MSRKPSVIVWNVAKWILTIGLIWSGFGTVQMDLNNRILFALLRSMRNLVLPFNDQIIEVCESDGVFISCNLWFVLVTVFELRKCGKLGSNFIGTRET